MPDFDARDHARQVNVAGDNTGMIDASVHQALPVPRPVVTTALRRDVQVFIDRDHELQRILDAVGPGRAVSVHTVDGMAGVGKTALVTRAAHRLAPLFPDGCYFVDLHSHTPGHTPADPAEVLGGLLIGLGIDPRHIPDSLAGRRDQWRDRLIDKRVLLVLDDARDHAQIEPLLPSGPGCLTLVTSRRRLIALDDAKPLPLNILGRDPAIDLFGALAHRSMVSDTDRHAVARIVELCGCLPLAIALLAGRLAHHPAWTIPDLADEFAATNDRLAELDAGDRAAFAAFTMSYQHLPSTQQRLFRHLGLHPGRELYIDAAAALADLPVAVARRELDALYVDHLIDEIAPGRYRLHDLLREYARALALTDPPEDNDRALGRVLDHYQRTATAADRRLAHCTRPTGPVVAVSQTTEVRKFASEVQALSWMRIERANLLACLDYAAFVQNTIRVVDLTGTLASLLEHDGPLPKGQELHRHALAAARQLADKMGEANSLYDLGRIHMLTEDYAETNILFQQALSIYRELENRLGEANVLTQLGFQHQWTGGDGGADELQQALSIYRELGNRLGEANILTILGAVRHWVGGEVGDTELQQALSIYRELDYRLGEANALASLTLLRHRAGDYVEAADLGEQLLANYRDRGSRLGEAGALTNLGTVWQRIGNYSQATDLFQQALAIYRELGNRIGEANALGNLGIVRRSTQDYSEAAALFQQSLASLRELGVRFGEVPVLNEIGLLLIDTGELPNALDVFTDALELARSVHNLFEQARALEGLARCRAGLGDISTAVTALREAVEIFRNLDVPEVGPATLYLAALTNEAPR